MSRQLSIGDMLSSAQPGQRAAVKRADAAIDSHMWDGFFKEAVSWKSLQNPASKAFKPLKNALTGVAGKTKSLASSSGQGQLSHLGRSGTSALTTPVPRPSVP